VEHRRSAGKGRGKAPSTVGENQGIETRPDGWKRFEQAVDAAVKNGPRHRAADLKGRRRGRAAVASAKPKKKKAAQAALNVG
jgi:hypothetical protein